ncbi:MAG: M18 family aminopeptidase [Acidimicrobiia bacterium]
MEPGEIDQAYLQQLLASIESSPTPYHCGATVAGQLAAAGFTPIDPIQPLPDGPGRFYRLDGGSLIAWATGPGAADRFVVVGAHTDSPNLRVRANANQTSASWAQLGVEVYGGVLLNSWLDRDLGLAGRVSLGDGSTHLFLDDRPVLRIPQLAIHLDRAIRDKGLLLDPQKHLDPLWALADDGLSFRDYLAQQIEVEPEEILSWDVMVFDTQSPSLVGLHRDLIASARIDNQLSCFAGAHALAAVAGVEGSGASEGSIPVLALFDHEEVGSGSATGAAGTALASLMERIGRSVGMTRTAFLEALTRSYVVSADCAHATHPNYVDKHEPNHQIVMNAGVVVKRNANQRYASDAISEAPFRAACHRAEIPVQTYIHRNDLPCGSTIGPATSAQLGVRTIDIGAPQLAMHSARETAGVRDAVHLRDALIVTWESV